MKKGSKIMEKIFCILVAIYPILHRYASIIPQVTLAETLLILFLFLSLFRSVKISKAMKCLFAFCAYLVFHVFYGLFGNTQGDIFDAIGTTARLILLYGAMCFLIGTYYEIEFGLKCLRCTGMLLSVYALLQVMCSFRGIYLTTYLPFLRVMGMGNTDVSVRIRAEYGFQFRPCALLSEPAALCCYLLLVLAVILFAEKKPKYWVVEAALITLVCLVSRSSTGIIVVLFIWCLYCFQKEKLTRIKRNNFFIIMIFGAISTGMVVLMSGIWQYFIQKTFGGSISTSSLSKLSRLSAIEDMFNVSDTFHGILFGAGLAEPERYFPGFPRAYYCLGLLGGGALLVIQLIYAYKNADNLQKKTIVIYIVLNIGTEIMFGGFSLIYLSVILATDQNRTSKIRPIRAQDRKMEEKKV